MAQLRMNTSQEYPCLMCGTLGNIIRESQVDEERRIKCNDTRCSFIYTAKDSIDAKNAGLIPEGKREPTPDPVEEPVEDRTEAPERDQPITRSEARVSNETRRSEKAPRSPSFVILSKSRLESEFCTRKNLQSRVIHWVAQSKKFDVFELHPRKVEAKLSIE